LGRFVEFRRKLGFVVLGRLGFVQLRRLGLVLVRRQQFVGRLGTPSLGRKFVQRRQQLQRRIVELRLQLQRRQLV
jgi:hypothetical protein